MDFSLSFLRVFFFFLLFSFFFFYFSSILSFILFFPRGEEKSNKYTSAPVVSPYKPEQSGRLQNNSSSSSLHSSSWPWMGQKYKNDEISAKSIAGSIFILHFFMGNFDILIKKKKNYTQNWEDLNWKRIKNTKITKHLHDHSHLDRFIRKSELSTKTNQFKLKSKKRKKKRGGEANKQ